MKKHIFVHIPKTGGLSIKKQANLESYQHKTARDIRQLVGDENYFSSYRFAFARNPYDRFLSAYFYFYQMTDTHMFWTHRWDRAVAKEIKRFPKFRDFALHFNSFRYKNFVHFRPQTDFFTEDDHCIIDYIGRYENFDASWKRVCSMLELPPMTLKKMNSSVHAPWESYYDDHLRKLVHYRFADDFEFLGYPS